MAVNTAVRVGQWLREERSSRTGGLAQVAFGVCLVLTVAGAFVLRNERLAAITLNDRDAQIVEDCRYGLLHGDRICRTDPAIQSSSWWKDLDAPPVVADRQQILSAARVEREYNVVIRGGLIASLRPGMLDRPVRRDNLAYLFEVQYQRCIECNDGRTVVERRTYGPVRMAKLVSSADLGRESILPTVLESEATTLDALTFPPAGTGIAVAAVPPVAEAVLGNQAEALAGDDSSRAFVEQDLLSGKSVRLTYVDGVVTSIEPEGWTLTKPVAAHLFGQTIVPFPVSDSKRKRKRRFFTVAPAQFTAFLTPAQFLCTTHELVARTGAAEDGNYDLSLRLFARDAGRRDSPHTPASETPLGCLHFDAERQIVTDALLAWPLPNSFYYTTDRLLFETEFSPPAAMTVRYHCHVE